MPNERTQIPASPMAVLAMRVPHPCRVLCGKGGIAQALHTEARR
jgi:hypothetical protein